MFTLIIIRVGLGYTVREISGNSTNGFTSHGPAVQTIGGSNIGLRPMAINVQVSQENDGSSIEMYDHKHTMAGEDIESGRSR